MGEGEGCSGAEADEVGFEGVVLYLEVEVWGLYIFTALEATWEVQRLPRSYLAFTTWVLQTSLRPLATT